MFKRKLLSATCLAVALGSSSAYAGPYLNPTGADNTENDYVQLLEDNFYETLIRDNGQGVLEVVAVDSNTKIQEGDLFVGVQKIQQTELAAPEGGPSGTVTDLQSGKTFTALFVTKVTSVTEGTAGLGDNDTDTLLFGAAGTSTWETLFGNGGLLDISTEFDITDLDQNTIGNQQVSADTAAMLFWGADYDGADATVGTLSTSTTSYVKDAELQYEFGFTGAADEFWNTEGKDALYPITSGANNPSVKLALNVTKQWAGPELDQHDYRQSVGDVVDFTGKTHLQANGSVNAVATGTPWGVNGDVDEYIRPIPEPASLGLLSLGLLGLGFAGKRRKFA